jgi:hypothetical protein
VRASRRSGSITRSPSAGSPDQQATIERFGALPGAEQNQIRAQHVRFRGRELRVEVEHLARVRERPAHDAADHDGIHLVQRVLERRDDAEIAATAAQTPEELRVLAFARMHEMAVGGDDVGGLQVVAGEAETAAEAAETAAERETGGPRVRDGTGCGREPERRALTIELAEQRAGLEIRRLRPGIDAHAAHWRKVDHDSTVARRFSGRAVSTGPHRREQLVFASEVHRAHHVTRTDACGDQRGALVDASVPHAPRLLVSRAVGQQQLALQAAREIGDIGLRKSDIGAAQTACRQSRAARGFRAPCACKRQIDSPRERSPHHELASLHLVTPQTDSRRI